MKNTGILRIQAFGARQSSPIEGVLVTVSGNGFTAQRITDETGTAADLSIEAPSCALSLQEDNTIRPYAVVDLTAAKAGFRTVRIQGVQIFAGQITLAQPEMIPETEEDRDVVNPPIVIPEHSLFTGDGGSGPDPMENCVPRVLSRVIIPKNITVHLGKPAASARNVTVSFRDYIANVASSEVYPTWPEQALRANIHCQISLALNRIYTEWYPSKGYTFNITNSTSYDQYYVHGRTVFDVMVRITDDIFNTYLRKTGTVNPYYSEYCDGKSVTCPGLKQWGTVTLANQGRNALQILKYYYGNDIEIIRTSNIQSIPQSYPGSPIRKGDSGTAVFTLQRQLNRITKDYPFLGLLTVDGVFGAKMAATVRAFQKQFNLIADGVYDRGKTADLGRQGLNGWLWGLITLDSMKYTIPAGASYTRTELVKTILSYQLSDDGFNLRVAQGSTADPDITAMAIQSMGPYYRTSTLNVKDPVDRALERLSQLQLDTADFRSWGTRNSESTSQVIISLCSVGIDPQNDPRFVKNGLNLLDALFYYQQEDGGFAHSYELDEGNPSAVPGESDSMATDQALLALVSVWRQAQGMSPLYDFRPGGVSSKILTPEESEVSFAGSYEFTQELQSRVDALPDALSTEDAEEVAFLLERLKMSREFDGYDRYMEKLTAAQEKIDALYAEIESLNADIAAEILPMTDAGLKEKPIVDGIVKRYRALSEHDRELVESWDAVLAVKAQTDAAQRTLLLCIGGAAVVMIGGSILVRRRRESK